MMSLAAKMFTIGQIIKSALLSMVALTTPMGMDLETGKPITYVCSAFIVSASKGEALTAKHCIKDGTLADGEETEVIRSNDALALIKVPIMTRPPLSIADDSTRVGDNIVTFGYGWGDMHVFQRHVSAFVAPAEPSDDSPMICDQTIIVLDGPLAPGMSGGPMVNEHLEVVGINQASNTAIGLGCGAREIRKFLSAKK